MSVSGRPSITLLGPDQPVVNPQSGQFTGAAFTNYWAPLDLFLASIQTALGPVLGVNRGTLAAQPVLGASDAGYVYFVTDYLHLVYWDGAAWQWLDGDVPGRFSHFYTDPGAGYQLCDGTATTLLQVGGATLTTAALTTPDLTVAAYLKSTNGGGYTGAPVAAAAPGASVSGSTAAGTTGNESNDHTHTFSATTSDATWNAAISTGPVVTNQSTHDHSVSGTTSGVSATHTHSIPALGAGTLAVTVDALADPRHLLAPVYVRR